TRHDIPVRVTLCFLGNTRESAPWNRPFCEARRLRSLGTTMAKSRSLDRSRYAPELLRRVTAGWRQLAERERHGALQAARITAELTVLGAPPSILTLAAHVVQEKVRHLEVCGRVLAELGDDAARSSLPLELTVGVPRPSVATETGLARTLVSDFAL